ncbi:MAG: DUF4231 domain-containing protein [Methylophaga sp.]|nr:MAG: DUF4231 domain-containing protein [Methylophaga sp.]
MLKKWRSRYKRAQLAHSYTAVSYGRYNFTLGIILIILTTASSVLIFSDFKCYFWLSPTVGVFAALFAYLQTFLSFSKNAEIHRVVERSYGALKKEVEYLINFNSGEDISKKVNDIREKENTLSSEAPHSLSYNWKKAKKETQDENDQYSIRTNT